MVGEQLTNTSYAVQHTPYGKRAQGGPIIEFSADTFRLRFAEKLGKLARANGWPKEGQVQFAELVTERTGVSMKQPRISDLLRGTKKPSLQEVEMIAIGLDASPGWLAFEDPKRAAGSAAAPAHPPTHKATRRRALTPAEKAAAARRTAGGKGGGG